MKDDLSDQMQLKWNQGYDQPPGFMNFPESSDGKYTLNGFFIEFEGEERIPELNADGTTIGYQWKKKTTSSRNHFWDCRLYNIACKHIFVKELFKSTKIKDPTWQDYVDAVS